MKCIFSHSLWNAMQRKTIRFSAQPEIGVRSFLRTNESTGSYHYYYGSKEEELRCDQSLRDYIAPTICSLCSNSIAAVSREVDPNHSQLLLTMVRLYANRTLVMAVFSSLESSHLQLLREYRGEKVLQKKLLVICTVLSKAARLETGLAEHPRFTEDIVESVLLLLKCDLVDTPSAGLLLAELVKVGGSVGVGVVVTSWTHPLLGCCLRNSSRWVEPLGGSEVTRAVIFSTFWLLSHFSGHLS